MDAGATKKEAAILELSYELNKELEDLQSKLDASFAKGMKGEPTRGTDAPETPNVLDDILVNLHAAINKVRKMHDFVVHIVIDKIHN